MYYYVIKTKILHFCQLFCFQEQVSMGQLFAKSTPKETPKTEKRTVSDKDKAVLKLKRARDKLTKFQKKVHTAHTHS